MDDQIPDIERWINGCPCEKTPHNIIFLTLFYVANYTCKKCYHRTIDGKCKNSNLQGFNDIPCHDFEMAQYYPRIGNVIK